MKVQRVCIVGVQAWYGLFSSMSGTINREPRGAWMDAADGVTVLACGKKVLVRMPPGRRPLILAGPWVVDLDSRRYEAAAFQNV